MLFGALLIYSCSPLLLQALLLTIAAGYWYVPSLAQQLLFADRLHLHRHVCANSAVDLQHHEGRAGSSQSQDPCHTFRLLCNHPGEGCIFRQATSAPSRTDFLTSSPLQIVDFVVFRLQGNAICNVGEVAIAPESVPEQTFTPLEWGLLELCQVLALPMPRHAGCDALLSSSRCWDGVESLALHRCGC